MNEEYEYAPEVVLLKENTYVRPGELDYFSFTPDEGNDQVGTVQLLFPQGTGLNVAGVAKADFKRLADTANWDSLEQERKRKAPVGFHHQ